MYDQPKVLPGEGYTQGPLLPGVGNTQGPLFFESVDDVVVSARANRQNPRRQSHRISMTHTQMFGFGLKTIVLKNSICNTGLKHDISVTHT